jgi:transglutaminase-like putative cysteine protease
MMARRAPGDVRVRALGWTLLACLVATCVGADALADVLLHEYVPPEPAEDVRLGATTSDGAMPAAIETQSGPVPSPDPERAPPPDRHVYGADASRDGPGGAFHVDRDTSRPDVVSYEDPFTPSIAPYKREFAYDMVNEQFDLVVRDASLTRLSIGGAPRAEDDQFYADLSVNLTAGQAVRIPTAGPGARLLGVRSVPATGIEAYRDSADDWFVKGDREGRVRLVLHVAIDRAAFGSPFADVEWTRLWRFVPSIPDHVKSEGIRVARQIGVVDGTGPSEALGILVRHFRSFAPSNDPPRSSGADLYHELAISKKGVCRHRAYAFVVTALALGIPSRFVRNEAHAWVEVFDSTRWHRIDLGGAARELDTPNSSRIAHVPPRDPFDWPPGAESGQSVAERTRAASPGGSNPSPGQTDQISSAPAPAAEAEPHVDADASRPHSKVTVVLHGADTKRGARVAISGRVEAPGGSCSAARVDLFLEPGANAAQPGSSARLPLGTLVTGPDGSFDGRVVVPYVIPPGDYEVRATTPGSTTCGAGASE